MIYGAGEGGELALREVLNNATLKMRPACFIDDDPQKHGTQIHGVPVIGGRESLALAVNRYKVSTIVIGTRRLPLEATEMLRTYAAREGVAVIETDFGFRPVDPPADHPTFEGAVEARPTLLKPR